MLIERVSDLPNLSSVKALSFDLETCDPSLKELGPGVRRDGYVLGVALAAGNQSWYLPLAHADSSNLPPEAVWGLVGDVFKTDACILGANIGYDLDYAIENGWPYPSAVHRRRRRVEAGTGTARGDFHLRASVQTPRAR